MKAPLEFLLKAINEALEGVDPDALERTVDLILSARKVFIYGVGRSGLVGQSFSVRLVQLGLDVHFVGDMTTPLAQPGDLAIMVSNTGETMSAVQTANIVRRVGTTVISVTASPNSKLAAASNHVLALGKAKGEDRKRYAPLGTVFEDAALILFDCVVAELMERTGQTEASLKRRHAIWV